jgi:hypothetical protein
VADLTHLQHARAVTAGDENHHARREAEASARTMHQAWADEYVQRLDSDDPGPAIAYLHRLRYDPPAGFDVWRFLERVAAALATRKDG